MTIGDRLKQFMAMRQMTKAELSKLSGVPRSTLTNLEKGKQLGLTLDYARRLARALGVSIDMLAGDMKAADVA